MVKHGSLNLTTTSPAQSFTEPFTVQEIRSYLGLPSVQLFDGASDLDQNSEIEAYIAAAREQAEILQGRDLVAKRYDLSIDYWPCYEIELRDNVETVDLVQYKSYSGAETTLTENTDYVVDTAKHPAVILPPYGSIWPTFVPWPSSSVLVRFTVTPPAIPYLVVQGMKLLISAWFNNKLPFEIGASAIQEYPFAVTNCLSAGSLTRIR